jgi:hypothetical protein
MQIIQNKTLPVHNFARLLSSVLIALIENVKNEVYIEFSL